MPLNPEQSAAALSMLHGPSCFLTGPAGTGKTYTLNNFLTNTQKNTVVCASTGMAALLIGGCTFHSLFGLGVEEGFPSEVIARALKKPKVSEVLGEAEVIIIDEVSMLHADSLSMASRIAQEVRGSAKPFGGIKIIFVGDFFQLPPVGLKDDEEWAFNSSVWQQMTIAPCGLTQSMRADSQEFVNFLMQLRHGRPDFNYLYTLNRPQKETTHLYSLRKQTDAHNQAELAKLKGTEITKHTSTTGPAWAVSSLVRSMPVPEHLTLKEGALVMCRKNNEDYVNGSTGIVKKIKPDYILVALHNGKEVEIERATFKSYNPDGTVLASAHQYPLCLAYAITIHKAQGATLDSATLNLSNLWEPGHAYVAISRVRRPEHLNITKVAIKGIRCSKAVEEFYKQSNLL